MKQGTFDNPMSTEGLTQEEICNLVDAEVILDLRAPEDKAADDLWSTQPEGMPPMEECEGAYGEPSFEEAMRMADALGEVK